MNMGRDRERENNILGRNTLLTGKHFAILPNNRQYQKNRDKNRIINLPAVQTRKIIRSSVKKRKKNEKKEKQRNKADHYTQTTDSE